MCEIIGSDKTEITACLESGLAFSYLFIEPTNPFLFLIVVYFEYGLDYVFLGGALFGSPDSVLLKLCDFCVRSAF